MKKDLAAVLSALVFLGTATSAMAGAYGEPAKPEEGPVAVAPPPVVEEPPPSGFFYIGAGALFSIENFHCDADNAWGYEVRAGRRINDIFAVEVEWEHPVEKFDDADIVDGHGRLGKDIEVWNLTANAKAYPIAGRFQPYALVGAGYGEANLPHDQNDGFIARFGLGIDIAIVDNFGMMTEVGYVLGTDDLKDYDQIPISVGVFYNFL